MLFISFCKSSSAKISSKLLKKYLGKEYLELYTAAKQGESEHIESSFVPREEYDLYL